MTNQNVPRDLLFIWDLETTSAEPSTARVVQLAGVTYTPSGTEGTIAFNQLCKPPVDISDGAAAVHGIKQEQLEKEELDHLAMNRLGDFIEHHSDRVIMAGHNLATFDKPILENITGRKFSVPVIDTLVCAIRTLPDVKSRKLSELVVELGLDSGEGAHDALADVNMVKKLVDFFCTGLSMDWEQLAEWCGQPRILGVMPFGKFKGKKFGRAPTASVSKEYVPWFYIRFMLDNFTNPSIDLVATLRHHYQAEFKA